MATMTFTWLWRRLPRVSSRSSRPGVRRQASGTPAWTSFNGRRTCTPAKASRHITNAATAATPLLWLPAGCWWNTPTSCPMTSPSTLASLPSSNGWQTSSREPTDLRKLPKRSLGQSSDGHPNLPLPSRTCRLVRISERPHPYSKIAGHCPRTATLAPFGVNRRPPLGECRSEQHRRLFDRAIHGLPSISKIANQS